MLPVLNLLIHNRNLVRVENRNIKIKLYHRGGFRPCQTPKMERFTKIVID